MNVKQAWGLLTQTLSSWIDDYAPSMGAALAYYTMFSIAPLLLIVIAVAGFIFGADAARGEILTQLQGLLGEDGAHAVEGLLKSVSEPAKSTGAAVIGIVVLLIGATSVFGELQDALDRIWRAPARDRHGGLWRLVKSRLLSFGMILGMAFLLMVSLVMSAALSALGKWWGPLFGSWETLLQITNFVVSFGLITVMFAMIYKIMPVFISSGLTSGSARVSRRCCSRSVNCLSACTSVKAASHRASEPLRRSWWCWSGFTIRRRYFLWVQSSRGFTRTSWDHVADSPGLAPETRCRHRRTRPRPIARVAPHSTHRRALIRVVLCRISEPV